jgi:MFS family permease
MNVNVLANRVEGTVRRSVIGFANRILILLSLMYLVFYIDRVNIATVAPTMMLDLRLSNTEFGLAISAFSYPYALFQLFGGWIGDRFGPQRTLLFCGMVVGVATMMTGWVGGLGSLIAARVALGFGEGSAFPASTRALALWLPESSWGFCQGVIHAAARLGNALTPPLVAVTLGYVSWRGSFVAFGLASLIWAAIWLWAVRAKATVATGELPVQRKKVPWLRLAKRMLPVTAVDFCYGWTLWVFLTWLPSFFFKSFHLDLKHSALFSSGVLLAGVIGDTAGGFISDRVYRRTGSLQTARRNLIIVGMLGAFVFLLPVVLTRDLTTVAICLSLACFFSELIVAPIWAVPMDIAPSYAASASGLMNFGFGLAGILSPLVFGKLLDTTHSWAIPFCGSLGLLILGAALSFFMRPDCRFEEG